LIRHATLAKGKLNQLSPKAIAAIESDLGDGVWFKKYEESVDLQMGIVTTQFAFDNLPTQESIRMTIEQRTGLKCSMKGYKGDEQFGVIRCKKVATPVQYSIHDNQITLELPMFSSGYLFFETEGALIDLGGQAVLYNGQPKQMRKAVAWSDLKFIDKFFARHALIASLVGIVLHLLKRK
jgi:hypothetical protein